MSERFRVYTTPAIVLRRRDQGEADRVLTLLTPERGKLQAIAKGVRKVRSRKAGHLELFARAQLTLAKGRTFDVITQAELVEPHVRLREDVERGGLAHYLCELTEHFAPEGSESAALFELLAEGLLWLCEATDPWTAARAYELRLLTLEGYRPQLFVCARTEQPLEVDAEPGVAQVVFSPSSGGVLGAAAGAQARDGFPILRETLLALRALQTSPAEPLMALSLPLPVRAEVARVTQTYLAHILERRLRSPGVLSQLQAR